MTDDQIANAERIAERMALVLSEATKAGETTAGEILAAVALVAAAIAVEVNEKVSGDKHTLQNVLVSLMSKITRLAYSGEKAEGLDNLEIQGTA